jgi:flagellar hook-basal body complex protein FliE
MDLTLGKVLPPGMTDYASRLADQLRPQGSGLAGSAALPALDDPTAAARAALQGIQPTDGAQKVSGNAVFESFSSVLNQALQNVNQVHLAADADAQKLAAGEEVDIHQVMIGMEKANVAFGLTLQVRNKLVEAYQEIMRMQV